MTNKELQFLALLFYGLGSIAFLIGTAINAYTMLRKSGF